jgi:hypothetical protein
VAGAMNIAVADFRGPGRRRDWSDARALAGYIGKRLGGISRNRMARYVHRDGLNPGAGHRTAGATAFEGRCQASPRYGNCARLGCRFEIIHRFRTDPMLRLEGGAGRAFGSGS